MKKYHFNYVHKFYEYKVSNMKVIKKNWKEIVKKYNFNYFHNFSGTQSGTKHMLSYRIQKLETLR